jgi:hypothetical protein
MEILGEPGDVPRAGFGVCYCDFQFVGTLLKRLGAM